MKKAILKNKNTIICAAVLLFTTIQLFYGDVNANTRQGILLWEALFSGRFFQYYSLSGEALAAGRMYFFANYEMLVNLIMGIWNLPLYIIERVSGIADICAVSMGARIYAQLYLPIFTLLAGRELAKLSGQLGCSGDEQEQLFVLFNTSVLVLISAEDIAQVDVIGVYFLLKALYHMMKKEWKRYALFLIFAAEFKYFALFMILPLILYREKNPIKICAEAACPVLGVFIISLPFRIADAAGMAEKSVRAYGMLEEMLKIRLPLITAEVPVLFIAYAAVCIYAYTRRPESDERSRNIEGLRLMLMGAMAFFLTNANVKPYWLIHFVPYILLLLYVRKEELPRCLLIESICCALVTISFIIDNPYCFNDIEGMPLKTFFHRSGYIHLSELHDELSLKPAYDAWMLGYAAFVVFLFYLVLSSAPKKTGAAEDEKQPQTIETATVNRTMWKWIWLRATVAFVLANIAALFYFFGKW